MKTTIVTTTIHLSEFLTEYSMNVRLHGHGDVDFIVVGDLKSHAGTADFCAKVLNCRYLDLAAQEAYLGRFLSLRKHLPLNSVERRNIGMVMAYENGADNIITLDDDNYAMVDYDIIMAHGIVGSRTVIPTFESSTGWYNVCSILKEQNDVEFYHRGFPLAQRWRDGLITSSFEAQRVVVNAGLWIDNPDVDAITRLERELVVTGYKSDRVSTGTWPSFNRHNTSFALAPGTWSPFNCQNTSLAREVIPAYFLSPYAGRHSDIIASFVVNRLAEHFGDVIAFGDPLARHTRTPHDLWKDLDAERDGIRMADSFCDKLRKIKLTATSYHEGFGQIIKGLIDGDLYGMECKIVAGMIIWHNVFDTLIGLDK